MLGELQKGLDVIWETVQYALRNENMELWQDRFRQLKTNTVETTLLGERIILTDDPENIKAILASQFADYGMVCLITLLYLSLH